jgi:serine/threonine-protein kinase
MALGVGDVFAGYTIVRQLGAGGMGEVYLAAHPRLPRRDAVKILRPEISADPAFRQRFVREADSVAALSHPSIVTVYDRGETDGRLWIATQYVAGIDASRLLRSRYPAGMPADEVVAIIAAVGDALDYAHERGLVHRDVKPANILLADPDRGGRRRVFLADFGIARPLGDPSGLTATNFTVGTVAYAAPEQLMGGDIDGRADEYALAATAFHLLTGRPAFEDTNPIAVISKHLTSPPPRVGPLCPGIAGLDAVLSKAMAKSPAERYSDCGAFTRDLARLAADITVGPYDATQAAVPAPLPGDHTPKPPPHKPPTPQLPASTPQPAPGAADRVTGKPSRNRRPAILVALAAVTALASGLGIAYKVKVIDGTYYVAAYSFYGYCAEPGRDASLDPNCDNVAIMRGMQGSILGIKLQQRYFIGCLNDRGDLSLLRARREDFRKASLDMQQSELRCERMRLRDLPPSERAQVKAGLPSGSLDDATNQLRQLAVLPRDVG